MKTLQQRKSQFQSLVSTASNTQQSKSFSTITNATENFHLNTKPNNSPTLTQEEISKINLLIPRLCLSNHLPTAIQLTTMALLTQTSPPLNPKSLSLSILVHSLTLQPDLKLPMSFLTRLSYAPQARPNLSPIATMLITSYIKKGRLKDGLKVYKWMLRHGSTPRVVDKAAYGNLISGFCKSGLVVEGLMILKDMLRVHLWPGEALREKVVRSLLREARIKEAKALEEVLACVGGVDNALSLLDHLIENWIE